jgi:hypothetical protein
MTAPTEKQHLLQSATNESSLNDNITFAIMDTTRIAHLEMIQRAIERMAGESANMKKFALASTAAVVATAGATKSSAVAFGGIFLLLIFWRMDAQYLAQERRFREMYGQAL